MRLVTGDGSGHDAPVAKFLCRCGSTIRTSGEIPNPQQWLLVSDAAFDQLAGSVHASDHYGAMVHAYKGDDCGRLWIFWKGYDADPTEYAPQ
jgi:hypothetical protein